MSDTRRPGDVEAELQSLEQLNEEDVRPAATCGSLLSHARRWLLSTAAGVQLAQRLAPIDRCLFRRHEKHRGGVALARSTGRVLPAVLVGALFCCAALAAIVQPFGRHIRTKLKTAGAIIQAAGGTASPRRTSAEPTEGETTAAPPPRRRRGRRRGRTPPNTTVGQPEITVARGPTDAPPPPTRDPPWAMDQHCTVTHDIDADLERHILHIGVPRSDGSPCVYDLEPLNAMLPYADVPGSYDVPRCRSLWTYRNWRGKLEEHRSHLDPARIGQQTLLVRKLATLSQCVPSPRALRVYFDVGATAADDSLSWFLSHYPMAQHFRIHSYGGDPAQLAPYAEGHPNVFVHPEVLWNESGFITEVTLRVADLVTSTPPQTRDPRIRVETRKSKKDRRHLPKHVRAGLADAGGASNEDGEGRAAADVLGLRDNDEAAEPPSRGVRRANDVNDGGGEPGGSSDDDVNQVHVVDVVVHYDASKPPEPSRLFNPNGPAEDPRPMLADVLNRRRPTIAFHHHETFGIDTVRLLATARKADEGLKETKGLTYATVRRSAIAMVDAVSRDAKPEDFVVMRLDGRGFERDLLTHMIDQGVIGRIDELFLVCNNRDMNLLWNTATTSEDCAEIINTLRAAGVFVHEWYRW